MAVSRDREIRKRAIFEEIVEILRATNDDFDVSQVRLDDTPLRAYGIDSLRLIRWATGIEERYGIEIDESEALTATTFRLVVDLVDTKLEAIG